MRLVSLLVALLSVAGCRSTYYSAWEKLGKEKRDLLVDQVEAARGDQKETAEEFKDALTRLQEAYGKSGSELEGAYDRLKAQHGEAASSAAALRDRARKMDRIATDLFAEWEREIESFRDVDMRRQSTENLARTRVRYRSMAAALGRAEARMDPVLAKLGDHVTFLKHSLNAQAIGALEVERRDIERGIASLPRGHEPFDRRIRGFPAHHGALRAPCRGRAVRLTFPS